MITDWDDAYTNSAYIPEGEFYAARWQAEAEVFRLNPPSGCTLRLDVVYGPGARNKLDLFMPPATPVGLFIFVHGGYWLRFDKSMWSHLARGALEWGWAVAMPSYTLSPECSVSRITVEVAQAVEHALSLVQGPVVLAGHSAGGHLVTRMVCASGPLSAAARARIANVMSISGLHDLRSLRFTAMGPQLFRTTAEAAEESPALLEPIAGSRVTCWVGSEERPEFLRQNDLLANIWSGLGADMRCHHALGHHHYNVIEGLSDAKSELLRLLLEV